MKAVLIPGDGIGKEISKSVVDITKAMKLDIEWVEYQAGAEYAATTKEVFEPGLVDAIKEYKWALKGPTATPMERDLEVSMLPCDNSLQLMLMFVQSNHLKESILVMKTLIWL